MKTTGKILSAVLACVMLISVMSFVTAFAAEEKVLYEDNFDALSVGDKPKGLNTTENEEREALSRVAKDGSNNVLHIFRKEGNAAGGDAGPRANLKFDMSAYDSLTITFKTKSMGAKPVLALYCEADKQSVTMYSADAKDWTDIEVKVDLKKGTFTLIVGGKESKKGDLPAYEDPSKMQMRFSAGIPKPGQGVYFDDIKIVGVVGAGATSGDAGTTQAPTDVLQTPAVAPTTKATAPTLPKNATVFINTDFSEIAETAKAQNLKIFSGGTDFTQIVNVNGDHMLRYWATDGKQHGPRIDLALSDGVNKQSIDFAVFLSGAKSRLYLTLFADGAKKGTQVSMQPGKKGVKSEDWNYVHLDFDYAKLTLEATINGGEPIVSTFDAINAMTGAKLRLDSVITANEVIYIDGLAHYTTEEVKYDGLLKGNNEIAWENVVPSKPIDANSFVKNVTAHPRLFVHDWNEMRVKVNADYMTRQWYANIKKDAEQALKTAPTGHVINSRGNVLESARSARGRIISMAFVYKIEGDKRYLDKTYEEMLSYGKWPDWSGFKSTLVTAEILQGYAYCYDWLYDDLTAEQKQKIIEIVKKQALPDFIYNYEGVKTSTNFTTGTINWNPVCNATIIAWALASADEDPVVAEYLLEKAPPFIQNSLPPYGPQGGYPEGVSYWDYGTSFLIFATDFLEKGFVDGFKLPDNYVYWKAPGIAETVDYAIYYDGPAGRFNYGDCSTGHTTCELLYWAADRFNKPQYAWWQDNRQLGTNTFLGSYSAIASLAWYNPDNAYYVPGAFPLDKFYSSEDTVNGASMRSSWDESTALYAAMQGGNNQANHQHLSLGTYIIDYMGKRFIRNLNGYDYALAGGKQTIYYKRAESYNTLVINPSAEADQKAKSVAKLINSGSSDNTAFAVMDMTQTRDDYKSAKRGIMMTDNRTRVIVQDEVTAKNPSEFYWFANSDANIKIAKDGKSALLEMDGDRMLVRIIEGPAEAKFATMDRKSVVEGINNWIGTNDGGKKLYIHLTNTTELKLAVEYVALKAEEGIPAPSAYVPLDSWSANDNGMSAPTIAGSNVVLKLDTPNAIANGAKTFVDTNNASVVPFTENGRTLVPVRFISEAFGAKVGWDELSQTVTVTSNDKVIKLVIGSNQMLVNDAVVTLDVPANTYNSRTLIPLRALVEALGKTVFWDDRGLISISDNAVNYTEEQLVKLIGELDVRVKVNGRDVAYFLTDDTTYAVDVKEGQLLPQVEISTIGGEVVSATQAGAIGEAATVTINGKVYTFMMQQDPFAGVFGDKEPGTVSTLVASLENPNLPSYNTFIYVQDLADSTGFASYPKRGIVDGVINAGTANRWAAQGADQWIMVDFGEVKNVYSMAFAGDKQESRSYNFEVEVSADGQNWVKVHEDGAPTTSDYMNIIPLGGVSARYAKLIGKGNNQNAWNTYTEVRFYDSIVQQNEDMSFWPAYFGTVGIAGKAGTMGKIALASNDSYNKPVTIRPDAVITYKVKDANIASVATDGTVSFVSAGKTTVTVTVTQDGFTVTTTADIVTE